MFIRGFLSEGKVHSGIFKWAKRPLPPKFFFLVEVFGFVVLFSVLTIENFAPSPIHIFLAIFFFLATLLLRSLKLLKNLISWVESSIYLPCSLNSKFYATAVIEDDMDFQKLMKLCTCKVDILNIG